MSAQSSGDRASSKKIRAATFRNLLLVPFATVFWILIVDPGILGPEPLHVSAPILSRLLAMF